MQAWIKPSSIATPRWRWRRQAGAAKPCWTRSILPQHPPASRCRGLNDCSLPAAPPWPVRSPYPGPPALSPACPLRIGVLTTLSGPAADGAGAGSVLAARMAAEAQDLPAEILSADMGDRPDVGAALARAWLDRDGVHAIVDVPNSATALAVAGIVRERNRIALFSGAGTTALTTHPLQPQPPAMDLRHRGACRLDSPRRAGRGRAHLVLPHRRLRLRPRPAARRDNCRAGRRRQRPGRRGVPRRHDRLLRPAAAGPGQRR